MSNSLGTSDSLGTRRDGGAVQSVTRAVTVLEILARTGEAGVTDIAAELGVHKSTAFRLIAALEQGELVAQDTARGKYRLGMGILRLAGAAGVRLDLVQESRTVCQALASEVGETINIAVLSGRDALYLDQVMGPSALSQHNWIGQRIPLHATSDGKVFLAYLFRSQLAEVLAQPMQRFTKQTITSIRQLERELADVCELGYATAVDELEVGLSAIAAPIRNVEGVVIASISASGPSFRLSEDRLSGIAAAVRRAADKISRRLGSTGQHR
jgi:DNA-binding IclR family transcriptional regulator